MHQQQVSDSNLPQPDPQMVKRGAVLPTPIEKTLSKVFLMYFTVLLCHQVTYDVQTRIFIHKICALAVRHEGTLFGTMAVLVK